MTVSRSVSLAVFAPSLTVTVIVAVPYWLARDDRHRARRPAPAEHDVPFGTRTVLLDVPVSVRFPAAVSASPTVKLIAPMAVSSVMA